MMEQLWLKANGYTIGSLDIENKLAAYKTGCDICFCINIIARHYFKVIVNIVYESVRNNYFRLQGQLKSSVV